MEFLTALRQDVEITVDTVDYSDIPPLDKSFLKRAAMA
jgi:hypothetical protein